MHKINIKALSVNDCWRGRRFKTDEYKRYERDLLLLLPKGVQIPAGDLSLFMEVGQSNMCADIDNPCKPFFDILCKKYGFDDRQITEAVIKKKKVAKGQEYILFNIISADV